MQLLCKKFGANAFMCSIKEKLESENKLPLAVIPDIPSAEAFLTILNESHPSITFTMEMTTNNKATLRWMESEMN